MNAIELCVGEGVSAEERGVIIGGLVGYNDAVAAPAEHRELSVVARNGEREIVGGLLGFTNWKWLFVQQLWVADGWRSRGTGRALMEAAEQEARARGCGHAHLDTFGFQALPFYEKLGYEVFGELEDFPAGQTRYFLQKRDLARP